MTNKKLHEKKCGPCENDQDPMNMEQISEYASEVPGWEVLGEKKLHRKYGLANFKQVRDFVEKISDLADQEGHHPDVCFSYDYVDINISTHSIGGLSENDFILASKINNLDSK